MLMLSQLVIAIRHFELNYSKMISALNPLLSNKFLRVLQNSSFRNATEYFRSLLQATSLIPDSVEEINNTKLDILLSLSLIAVQFHDVCGDEAVKIFEVVTMSLLENY